MHTQQKPLAQKLDEQVFEKMLKYNPQTQNLWDIVGFFENEREKLRLEIAQYHEEIKESKAHLKTLREHITFAQNAIRSLEAQQSQIPSEVEQNDDDNALKAQIAELELENSKLRVELRDIKSELQLEEKLTRIAKDSHNAIDAISAAAQSPADSIQTQIMDNHTESST